MPVLAIACARDCARARHRRDMLLTTEHPGAYYLAVRANGYRDWTGTSVIGILCGSAAAAIVYWLGAVISLLAMRGIPLGSGGGPPTNGELLVHLMLGFVAAIVGGALAIRVARAASSWLPAVATGLILALVAMRGFGKASSQWPGWFGFAMAAACFGGALAAGAWTTRRNADLLHRSPAAAKDRS